MFAQVRAVPATVCKIADDSLPRFESWTCHQKPQVKPGVRTGPGDVGERCRTPPVQPARTQNRPAASSKKTGDQPGCQNTPHGAVCRALSFSCTSVALPAASPARSQVHALAGTQNMGRMAAVDRLVVQARFRAARDATRHGYRSNHDGDADHVTDRVRTARGFGGWCSSAGLNPAISAARAAPPLPMLPPTVAGDDVQPHTLPAGVLCVASGGRLWARTKPSAGRGTC
jgi:hypothetical protein